MLNPLFWLAFGSVFWAVKTLAEAGTSLRAERRAAVRDLVKRFEGPLILRLEMTRGNLFPVRLTLRRLKASAASLQGRSPTASGNHQPAPQTALASGSLSEAA